VLQCPYKPKKAVQAFDGDVLTVTLLRRLRWTPEVFILSAEWYLVLQNQTLGGLTCVKGLLGRLNNSILDPFRW
jgi:hypothetical protein